MLKKTDVFLLLGIIVLTFYGCSLSFDKEVYVKEVVKSELSPNGKYQAVVFTDSGGDATVDFSKNVAILSRDQNLSKGDKLRTNQIIFKGYHIHEVVAKWQDNNRLSVYHAYDKGVIKQDVSKDGIEIQYIYIKKEITLKEK